MSFRSWLEINLSSLASNYIAFQSMLSPNMDLMAVVKADAYGYGAIPVSKALFAVGCRHFAVSNIDEACELREAGICGDILILGYTPVSCAQKLVDYDLTQTLLSYEYASLLAGRGIKAQFAIDTGMNRIGLDGDDTILCERTIRHFYDSFRFDGIFTHLACADTGAENDFTSLQLLKFEDLVRHLSDLNLKSVHCLNSAGAISQKHIGNLARLGIALYGLRPSFQIGLPKDIKNPLIWKSVISQIKLVHAGESIGYGRSFVAKNDIVVATIPTGYADGYSRFLSNKGHVMINGKNAKIVGNICMDQMMVDVTNLPVAFENEVVLLDSNYDADQMAKEIGTIGYEVICGISKRVERVYAFDNEK